MVQLGWRWHPGDFALITDILEILLENFSGFLVHCSDGFVFGLRMKLGFRLRIHYDSLPCLRLLGFLLSIRAQDCTSIGSHSPGHACQCLRRNGRMLEGPRSVGTQDGTVWQRLWVNSRMSSWKSSCLCLGFIIVIHHLFLSLLSHLDLNRTQNSQSQIDRTLPER